ncbi:MAG: hypothetical protein GX051_05280 [Clostridiales bacterium]|nr:hypothetical protein [Clostridiales bacterium]
MKKSVKTAILAIMVLSLIMCMSAQVLAADEAVTVYVTISDGVLKTAQQPVKMTDTDGDGVLTVNDALYLAHEAEYPGGAAAGYASAEGDYGPAITSLWGVKSGSGYGYYINNASAMSLADTVKNGDYISAFVYTDTVAYSDTYCFFDKSAIESDSGEAFTLTLNAAAFDENWQPVVKPAEGAVITVDGERTQYVTDSQGKVTMSLEGDKRCVISAVSDSQVLVPAACIVTVSEKVPDTDAAASCVSLLIFVAAAVCASVAIGKKDEK